MKHTLAIIVCILVMNSQENKFSFGFDFSPSIKTFSQYILSNNGYPYYNSSFIREVNTIELKNILESNITYHLDRLAIGFNFAYRSFTDTRIEAELVNNGNPSSDGIKITNENSTYNLTLFAKYYLKELQINNVRPYFSFGLEKQFTLIDAKTTPLGPDFGNPNPQPTPNIEDNDIEFNEDINSPFFLNLGFGTEYYFNTSLSFFSNIQFKFSHSSAKYYRRYYDSSSTLINHDEKEQTLTDWYTRVGFGLNFYF
jgi:hypothetical protein